MDGHRVAPLEDALPDADVLISATGAIDCVPARGARAPEGRRPDRERRPPRARGRDRRPRSRRGGAAGRHRARPRRRSPRLRARRGPPDERRRRRRPPGRDHGSLVLRAGARRAPAGARRARAGAALASRTSSTARSRGRSWRRSGSSSASRPRSSASSKRAGRSGLARSRRRALEDRLRERVEAGAACAAAGTRRNRTLARPSGSAIRPAAPRPWRTNPVTFLASAARVRGRRDLEAGAQLQNDLPVRTTRRSPRSAGARSARAIERSLLRAERARSQSLRRASQHRDLSIVQGDPEIADPAVRSLRLRRSPRAYASVDADRPHRRRHRLGACGRALPGTSASQPPLQGPCPAAAAATPGRGRRIAYSIARPLPTSARARRATRARSGAAPARGPRPRTGA